MSLPEITVDQLVKIYSGVVLGTHILDWRSRVECTPPTDRWIAVRGGGLGWAVSRVYCLGPHSVVIDTYGNISVFDEWAEIPADLLDQSQAPAAPDKPCYYCGQMGGTHAPRCLEVLP